MAPVKLPRKARRHVCVNTSHEGTSCIGVYRRNPPSEGTSHQRRLVYLPLSGGNPIVRAPGRPPPCGGTSHQQGGLGSLRVRVYPIIGAHNWMHIETTSVFGHIPSGGFLATSEWRHIPSSGHMARCTSEPPPYGRHIPSMGGFGWTIVLQNIKH